MSLLPPIMKSHMMFTSSVDYSLLLSQVRMALKYYQRLCKEYAICDLSRYREGAVGLRWRTEREVLR